MSYLAADGSTTTVTCEPDSYPFGYDGIDPNSKMDFTTAGAFLWLSGPWGNCMETATNGTGPVQLFWASPNWVTNGLTYTNDCAVYDSFTMGNVMPIANPTFQILLTTYPAGGFSTGPYTKITFVCSGTPFLYG
jgi:hypothetical protein